MLNRLSEVTRAEWRMPCRVAEARRTTRTRTAMIVKGTGQVKFETGEPMILEWEPAPRELGVSGELWLKRMASKRRPTEDG